MLRELSSASASSRRLCWSNARKERLASLATLAAGAAHELASPLATIAVAATELEKQLAGLAELGEARSDAALIRSQVERCRGVLDQLATDAGQGAGALPRKLVTRELLQRAAEGLDAPRLEIEVARGADMRTAVVSIDPHDGAVKAYYGGSDANGFDYAQAGLPAGSSFKVFALVAALQQGIGLIYRVDSGPVTVNGIKISNVEGEGCGTCSIAEALKRSLNISYYRLMLKLEHGPEGRGQGRARCGRGRELPGRRARAVRGRQGRTAEQRCGAGPVPVARDRHGLGVCHARGLWRLPQAAFRAEGRELLGPGPVRRLQPGQR